MANLVSLVSIFFAALIGGAAMATEAPAPITYTIEVPASIDEAWSLWSTKDGLQTFFAPYAEIEPETLGAFEIWFFPDEEPGQRGAEGMRVLAFEPNDRLVFTWNAPPHLPHARAQMAAVEVTFDEVAEGTTRVTLTHSLFGRHNEWHMTRVYFEGAWAVVMNRFAYAADVGPVDWQNPPEGLMYISPSRAELDEAVGRSD